MDSRTAPAQERVLKLEKVLPLSRETAFRAWTDASIVKQWFAPRPFEISDASMDVRAGGEAKIRMRSPDGGEFPTSGVYLEVVENERIVFTDAFSAGWHPSARPTAVTITSFSEAEGGTRVALEFRYWSAEDCARFDQMGFTAGWSQCLDQLVEVLHAN